MTRDTAFEVLAAKVVLPAYVAVRVWVVPAARVLVVSVATPLTSATEPMLELPSKKLMLPVGVPAAEEMVAEMVTAAPAAAGLGDAVSMMLVAAGAAALTTRATAVEVLVERPAVPAKVEVRLWVTPAARVLVV
jgi:hypothetical protein